MSDLWGVLLEELAGNPAALERLRELVGERLDQDPDRTPASAYTVPTLAAELGRSERSIRAAIARGELQAVKRGRGYVIAADAVADWARAPTPPTTPRSGPARPPRRPGSGPMARALERR